MARHFPHGSRLHCSQVFPFENFSKGSISGTKQSGKIDVGVSEENFFCRASLLMDGCQIILCFIRPCCIRINCLFVKNIGDIPYFTSSLSASPSFFTRYKVRSALRPPGCWHSAYISIIGMILANLAVVGFHSEPLS